ncbi:hypothetical protein BN979_02070 [Mycolicibacterium vulneris]|nr:hypothetical protein BN979_02070 [Mycolicibacterium vulneris]
MREKRNPLLSLIQPLVFPQTRSRGRITLLQDHFGMPCSVGGAEQVSGAVRVGTLES